MNRIGVIPALQTGDVVIIKDVNGTILKQGKMRAKTTSHTYAVTDNGTLGFTYHFEDEDFDMGISSYTVEVTNLNKGYRVSPSSITW